MSYFDNLLDKRSIDTCKLPLWKMKITEEEYEELRGILEKQTHSANRNANPYITLTKECALFFAEFWRREYSGSPHSKLMVYKALGSSRESDEQVNFFYEAACLGAKQLKIEMYDGQIERKLDSILYQGGLPMKLLTQNMPTSLWYNFMRGLVNRKINFDDLNLGIVATQSDSLHQYCNQLIDGLERSQYMLMPFYCENENDSWYLYLNDLAKAERKHRSQLYPFSLDWEFSVNTIEKTLSVEYVMKGARHLPQAFLEDQHLENKPFFSVQLLVNGVVKNTFDYSKNYSKYEVVSKHPYRCGDFITLIIDGQSDPYIADELDMSVPHLLFRNKDGKYEPGNSIGDQSSLLIIPEGWEVKNAEQYNIISYTWGDQKLNCIEIPQGFEYEISVTGDDGEIIFGKNAPLYWTELTSIPLYHPDVVEPTYNIRKCNFNLCFDTEEGIKKISNHHVQYRNKWETKWSDTPSYGEILARAVDNQGHFVTPTRLINIGDGLNITLLASDKESCKIKINWANGRVTTEEGTKKLDDIWEIKKEDCKDPRKIIFTLVPDGNSNNRFSLSIKAPFKDFSITNIHGEEIATESYLPYIDVDKYQYHIVGQDVREYTFGDKVRNLKWMDNKLYIYEGNNKLKNIPYEGSLLTLFDSREVLRAMLERTSKSMIKAEVLISFKLMGKTINLYVKESPYRVKQFGSEVAIFDKNKPYPFKGVLKLIKIDEPTLSSISMEYDPTNEVYRLPEEIQSWGKTMLVGRTRGRICPMLVDLTTELTGEDRLNIRENAINSINQELQSSKLGDATWQRILGWFDIIKEGDVPASSLLEMKCIEKRQDYLLYLAFQLFAKCNDEDEKAVLAEQLNALSKYLSFQWFWAASAINGIVAILYQFMGNPMSRACQEMYIKWALKQGEKATEYLSNLQNEEKYNECFGDCFMTLVGAFSIWMQNLCYSSLLDTYGTQTTEMTESIAKGIVYDMRKLCKVEMFEDRYIETSQEIDSSVVAEFFSQYKIQNGLGNELWLKQRSKAMAAHLKGEIDLFEKDDDIKRSLIYCAKSCHEAFVETLNNYLIQ